MMKRPATVKEIQSAQPKSEGRVRILNISQQLIKIHLKPPTGVDFYLGAQDVCLGPNKSYTFKRDRLWMEQVTRLEKQGKLQILSKVIDE
jgi:hypothetical protein